MADLTAAQQAAQGIYDPQLQSELTQRQNAYLSQVGALNEEQGTVEPAYQKALRGLTDQQQQGEGKLNQLYSQRMGGMFSGLQGNDLGMFFSKGNQQRTDIESDRAGKLANIGRRQSESKNTWMSDMGSINSKYQGMKNQYAQDLYQKQVQQEEDQRRYQAQMSLENQKLNLQRQQMNQQNQPPGAPGSDVINYFKNKLAQAGPMKAGNAAASRQSQDAWVYEWMLNNGVVDPGAQTAVWTLVNKNFNRSSDPTKDWLYKR